MLAQSLLEADTYKDSSDGLRLSALQSLGDPVQLGGALSAVLGRPLRFQDEQWFHIFLKHSSIKSLSETAQCGVKL